MAGTTLIGKEDRAASGSGNTILLNQTAMGERLLRVSIPAGIQAMPAQVTVSINEQALAGKLDNPTQVAEIAKAVAETLQGIQDFATAKNGTSCISADKTYAELAQTGEKPLGSFKEFTCYEVGSKEIDFDDAEALAGLPENKLRVHYNRANQCIFKIESDSRQTVSISVSKETRDKFAKLGVQSIQFAPYDDETQAKDALTTIELNKPSNEPGKPVTYYRWFALRVTGSQQFTLLKNGQDLRFEVKASLASEPKTSPIIILRASAIHPIDLVVDPKVGLVQKTVELLENRQEKKTDAAGGATAAPSTATPAPRSKNFFAFVSWNPKGGPSEVTFSDLYTTIREDPNLKRQMKGFFFSGIDPALEPSKAEAIGNVNSGAIGAYFGVCMVTHLGLDTVLGIFTGGLGMGMAVTALLDCGIPTGFAAASNVSENYGGSWLKFMTPFIHGIENIITAPARLVSGNIGTPSYTQDAGAQALEISTFTTPVRATVAPVLGKAAKDTKSVAQVLAEKWKAMFAEVKIPNPMENAGTVSAQNLKNFNSQAAELKAALDSTGTPPTITGAPTKNKIELYKIKKEEYDKALQKVSEFKKTLPETQNGVISDIDNKISSVKSEMKTIGDNLAKANKATTPHLQQTLIADNQIVEDLGKVKLEVEAIDLSKITNSASVDSEVISKLGGGQPINILLTEIENTPKSLYRVNASGTLKTVNSLSKTELETALTAAKKTNAATDLTISKGLGKWGTGLTFLKQLGIGLASNVAGYFAYQSAIKGAVIDNAIVIECPGQGVSGVECKLQNNTAYMITVEIDVTAKQATWTIVSLTSSTETDSKAWIENEKFYRKLEVVPTPPAAATASPTP
ncbi:MAG: hypothetical protein V1847_01805 [Candidatus Diapherotrites archaeon]